jgi:hypothetical protein
MPRRPVFLVISALALSAAALLWHFQPNQPVPPPPATVSPLDAFTPPEASQYPETALRPALRVALGTTPGLAWEQRVHLVRQLPEDLSEAETNALLAALVERRPDGVSAALFSSYIHEIACRLQAQPTVREPFAQALATLVRDSRRDPTSRDYAMQHLRQVWDRAPDNPAFRDAVAATFAEFAGLEPAIAASALLSLHLLGTTPAPVVAPAPLAGASRPSRFAVPDSEIFPLLTAVFSQAPAADNLPARLTACRIAGDRRLAGLRAPLLARLRNPAEHAMVRMAAANALGRIADPGDLAALSSYDPGDHRVATALQYALRAQPRP